MHPAQEIPLPLLERQNSSDCKKCTRPSGEDRHRVARVVESKFRILLLLLDQGYMVI